MVDLIIAIGRRRKEPRRHIKANLETSRIESNHADLPDGDADSYGYRQQRESIYGRDRLRKQINNFYDEADKLDRGQRAADLAADVQRPAAQYRGRYRNASDEAAALLGESGRGGPRIPSGGPPGASPDASGASRGDMRRELLMAYLENRDRDPNALLSLAMGLGDLPARTSKPSRPRDASNASGGGKANTAEELANEIAKFGGKRGLPAGSRDRSPASNAAVGGASDSDHLEGGGAGRGREGLDLPTTPGQGGWERYAEVVRHLGLTPDKGGFTQGTIDRDGRKFRVQIIFGEQHGHGDHIHVGFRRA